MKKYLSCLILVTFAMQLFAQKSADQPKEKPKLVVGIVVDQMRYDFLFRYWDKYSKGGFKRLVNQGYVFHNANYNYIPTYTAPGHACIYTGTTPAYNGIISNDWYVRGQKKTTYCVNDTTVKPVGTTSISGKMSPKNLLSTTMTDELRLGTNFRSKVVGIALKDRGSILPAGRTGTAYWHDPYSDNWITSTYYMNELPVWVKEFNGKKMGAELMSKPWTTLLPIEQYTESTADNTKYEGLFKGEEKPIFPHDLPALKGEDNELIRRTPFGNTFTKEFAVAALKGEQLGKGDFTDFLAVSFSSTDYVGHNYGVNAIETEDTYLRLDRDIEEFLTFLDSWSNDYVLFLTSDHGVALNPYYSKDNKLAAGQYASVSDSLKKYLTAIYNVPDLVLSSSAHNIYLDRNLITDMKLNLKDVQNSCVSFLSGLKSVSSALTADEMMKGNVKTGIQEFIQNGWNMQRSADVMIQLQPGWLDLSNETGTTHGAAYSYDTHVPVIFYGKQIPKGNSYRPVHIVDIAPTVCNLLNIEYPNANTGVPLMEILR